MFVICYLELGIFNIKGLNYNLVSRSAYLRSLRDLIADGGHKMEKHELKAPDAKVTMSDGLESHLRDLWHDRTLVLVFLRHFG